MKTRTLALAGLVLYVAAGAGCFFCDNIGILLVMRAILGVSVGMIMPPVHRTARILFPSGEAGLADGSVRRHEPDGRCDCHPACRNARQHQLELRIPRISVRAHRSCARRPVSPE